MATPAQFAQNMQRYSVNVERKSAAMHRRAAVAVLSAVVVATPVGNPSLWNDPSSAPPGYVGGRARGNWQVGLGGPKDGETGRIDGGGSSTIAAGRASIEQSTPGNPIHVTNNVPYIVPLNDGHSKQAPAGFVQTAIAAGIVAVQGAKLLE